MLQTDLTLLIKILNRYGYHSGYELKDKEQRKAYQLPNRSKEIASEDHFKIDNATLEKFLLKRLFLPVKSKLH